MAIQFTCANPDCGQPVRAPDGAAGKKAKCPLCGTIQVVPMPAGQDEAVGVADLMGLAEGEGAPRPAEPSPPPPPPPGPPPPPAGPVTCAECGTILPPGKAVCPSCGWVNPAALAPTPGAAPPVVAAAGGFSGFATACVKAVTYGASNFGSIFKLVLFATGLAIVLYMLFFPGIVLVLMPGGVFLVGLLVLAIVLVMGGYYLRFYLDCVISSLEGADQAPDVPEFKLGELIVTGLKGLGILLVYVVPIVTIPLLPLGLLALGYTNDARAYNVVWAAKAAVKRPKHLAFLWLMLVVWYLVMGVATGIVMYVFLLLAAFGMMTGCIGVLLGLVILAAGAMLAATVDCMFTAVQYRCIGMLGRHCPDLLEAVPDRQSAGQGVAFLCGGAAASVAVVVTAVVLVRNWVQAEVEEGWGEVRGSAMEETEAAEEDMPPAMRRLLTEMKNRAERARIEFATSQQRMKAVGAALRTYAGQHDGRFPASLRDLVEEGLLELEQLKSPRETRNLFRYVPGQTADSPPETIVAYDPALYSGRRVALRASFEVEVLPSTEHLNRLIQEQRRRKPPPTTTAATRPIQLDSKPQPTGQPSYLVLVIRSRDLAKYVRSTNDVRVLAVALQQYAMEFDGKFPPDLETLVTKGLASQANLRSPGSKTHDYVYLPGQTTKSPRTNILVFDPVEYPGGRRVVLRIDGSPQTLSSTAKLKERLIAQGVAVK